MKVFRLEFLQPDGRWTGPYCAEWMTERAFDIRAELINRHGEGDPKRPWPDATIFQTNPGPDRHVCGCLTFPALAEWFGSTFDQLREEGGHVGLYELPAGVPVILGDRQVIYMQRQAVLIERIGRPPPSPLVERIHHTKREKTAAVKSVPDVFDFRNPVSIERANAWGKSLGGRECSGCDAVFCPGRGWQPRFPKQTT